MNIRHSHTHRPASLQGAQITTPGEQSALTKDIYDGITNKGNLVQLLPQDSTRSEFLSHYKCVVCYHVHQSGLKVDCVNEHSLSLGGKCFIACGDTIDNLGCPECDQKISVVKPVDGFVKNIISGTISQCPSCKHQDSFENMDAHITALHPELVCEPRPDILPVEQAEEVSLVTGWDGSSELNWGSHTVDDLPRSRDEVMPGLGGGSNYVRFPQSDTFSIGTRSFIAAGGQGSTCVVRGEGSIIVASRAASISVPAGIGSSVVVGESGSIRFTKSDGVHFGEGQIHGTEVNKVFKTADVSAISLSTVSGTIKIHEHDDGDVIKISSSEYFTVQLMNRSISGQVQSCRIKLYLPRGRGGVLNLGSSSGNISGTVSIPGRIHSVSGGINISMPHGNIRVIANSTSGRITNDFSNVSNPRGSLNVSTCSGEIKVKRA